MSSKHSRSASDQSAHQSVRRRELTARRTREYRARQRALRNVAEIPTREQLQQGEQIVNLALTEEEAAAMTLTQLGLRVQGVTLAQDAADAREQEQATAIDEHQTLYEDNEEPQHLSPQQIH